MTASNRQNGEGSFGRSTGDAAVRGALLVGVAVIIGALLLWRGHDGKTAAKQVTTPAKATTTTVASGATGPSGSGVSGVSGSGVRSGSSGAVTGASGAVTGATGAAGLHKPSDVKVLVANGTGSANGAGNVTATLQPKGYAMLQAADANAANIAVSKVYYRAGYVDDAKQVARDMGVVEPVESLLEALPDSLQLKGATATANAKNANIVVVIGLDKKIKS